VIADQSLTVESEGAITQKANTEVSYELLTSGGGCAKSLYSSSNGTIASPSASALNDDVMCLSAKKYRGSAFEEIAGIRAVVESASAQSGNLQFDTWRSGTKVSHILTNGGLDLKGQTVNLRNNASTTLLALDATGMTGSRAQAFQDASGTIALTSDIPAVWTVSTAILGTATAADGDFILVSASTCIVTLPAPAAGARVALKVIAGTVTDIQLRTSGALITIDGTDYSASGFALTAQWEQINVISDGANWFFS
jgi:hypothetical protein